MYSYYYFHMTLLHVLLMSADWMQAVSGVIWLKVALSVANAVTFMFCIYCLLYNKQLANWWMEHMPAWMMRMMENTPDWMTRWASHKAMRIMMITMDIMLALICVQFAFVT
jgi:hypothetical protein